MVLLSSLAGCQCLVPVEDDAGSAMDGAVDTDGGFAECDAPGDCRGAATVSGWCDVLGADGGAWSCVQHRCVAQCSTQAGQTCEQDEASDCLRCAPAAACEAPDCTRSARFTWRVERVACSEDAGLRENDLIRELVTAPNCGIPLIIERPNGDDAFGTLYERNGRVGSARIERLGGVCIVTDLPTGLQRSLVDCPKCQFSMTR